MERCGDNPPNRFTVDTTRFGPLYIMDGPNVDYQNLNWFLTADDGPNMVVALHIGKVLHENDIVFGGSGDLGLFYYEVHDIDRSRAKACLLNDPYLRRYRSRLHFQ